MKAFPLPPSPVGLVVAAAGALVFWLPVGLCRCSGGTGTYSFECVLLGVPSVRTVQCETARGKLVDPAAQSATVSDDGRRPCLAGGRPWRPVSAQKDTAGIGSRDLLPRINGPNRGDCGRGAFDPACLRGRRGGGRVGGADRMMCETWTTDRLRWWGSGAFCVRLRCILLRQHRLEDVLRTAVSPVNFGVRSRWEVVHARDGDPVSLRMTTAGAWT